MNLKRDCKRCGVESDHQLARNQTMSGAVQVGLLCCKCRGWTVDRKGRLWIPLAEVRSTGIEPAELPVANAIAPDMRCARCGSRGVELHHWAPRALFGADADAWPKDYLCRPCHEEWHESVTPQLLAREAS